jgi:ABC-2 type transport system permease protein
MTAYSLVYLPPVLLLAALVVLLFGWLPRAAAATWAVVAGCFVIGWLGGLLKPPQWVENLSPFTHVPQVPAADVTAAPLVALLALTVAGVVVGWAGFLRRDIG